MAQAGAAAGGVVGGAGGGGGGGAGEEDVPDVRFLMGSKAGGDRWIQTGPLTFDITVEQKEDLLIQFLEFKKVGQEELNTDFRVSDALNKQPARVIAMNAHASGLSFLLGRKRRHCIFLHLMLQAYGERKNFNIKVPHRYRHLGQLNGDIKVLKDGINTLYSQLCEVCRRVKGIKGVPVKIPDVFKKDLQLPNACEK